MSTISKVLIILGIIIILIGLLLPWLQKLGLGHLPGDIVVKRKNYSFYFPIVTSLIVSLLISLILWFFRK